MSAGSVANLLHEISTPSSVFVATTPLSRFSMFLVIALPANALALVIGATTPTAAT